MTCGASGFDDRRVAVLSATAFVFSRAFLSSRELMARPDMATATFGLLALWLVIRHRFVPGGRYLVPSGAAAGLKLPSHPFGVVPAIEVGVTLLSECAAASGNGSHSALIYTAVVLAVFALGCR